MIAVYNHGQIVKIACEPGKTCFLVNATGRSEVYIDLQSAPLSVEVFDTPRAAGSRRERRPSALPKSPFRIRG